MFVHDLSTFSSLTVNLHADKALWLVFPRGFGNNSSQASLVSHSFYNHFTFTRSRIATHGALTS